MSPPPPTVADLAHEFGNLMTVLLGNLDMIALSPTDPNRPFVAAAGMAAARAADLAARLFDTPSPARPAGPLRVVLVLDDEPVVRTFARAVLEADGWAVEEAEDVTAGVARLGRPPTPAVVLLDLSVLAADGLAILAVRAAAPGVPVVLVSGRPAEDADGLGADGFLAKPFTRDQLVGVVRAVSRLPN